MDADVIVVGAGPVGLFLAAELKLAGAEPLVLERRETPSEEPRARGLGALATEALWRRGLGEQLAAAHVDGTKDLARDHGSTRGHFANIFKIVPDDDRPRTNIWQPELERVLAKHAEGVRVLRGHEVTALESDVDGVTVTAGKTWRARYVVGCDGGRSTIRKLAGFGFPGTPALLRTIAGQARFAGDVPPAGRYPGGTFLRGGSMVGVTEPASAPEPVTAAGFAASVRRVTGADVVVEEFREERRFTDQARQADTYRRGRVLLAGDAAHVHSPSGGQGLNLGVPDAANLGWKLGAVLRGDKPEAFLDTYTRERHPAGEAVLRNTRAQSALLAPGPHVDALREIVAEVMDLPEANRYFAQLLAGTEIRYDFPYPAGRPAGEHCPDVEIVDDSGRKSRLHEHTRTGRGLLLTTEHPADPRVDVVPATNTGPLLLRPDGVIAWAGEGPLDVALDTWF
ncbi:2-polyprenyl-6-methoxyphenol hydroxylase-like FAD-dependent oxidoreductase [Amycolatopsis lexingtonensis]|uniref:2-polyprenyl-6-methoxyphenol hydroxylase-like FAD-dependent oxidoreductase n=1 Tax=Amycolatopsis lexingtonensis TaxID=218822 RepID=A0ABR9IA64_9PSEU|nr:FAD-dependent monooxygenase [Amycolatopsis lexingtonensis]MBE1500088.1 2-polyprenyl-6-methoxyphenol hydroxylase-like FAD-dependent oxidoreductase [Amycolatopsis lexingtonensis]